MSEEDAYTEYMQTIHEHAGSNFLRYSMRHSRYLHGDGTATAVLSYLLNLLILKDKNGKDRESLIQDNFWFKSPAKNIRQELGMTKRRQQTAIRTLVKYQLITVQKRTGNYLWVRIDTDELKKIESGRCEPCPPGRCEPCPRKMRTVSSGGSETHLPYNTKNLSKTTTKTAAAKTRQPGVLEGISVLNGHGNIPEFCLEWHRQAYRILRSKRPLIPLVDVSERTGANAVHELYRSLGQDKDRIDRFLSAYETAIHTIDSPVPVSIKLLFRPDYFAWIERQLFPSPSKPAKKDLGW